MWVVIDFIRWSIPCAIGLLAVYYAVFIMHRPYIYFKGDRINRFFEKCDAPTSSFAPHPFLCLPGSSGSLQTYNCNKYVRNRTIKMHIFTEKVKESSGAEITLDWFTCKPITQDSPQFRIGVDTKDKHGILVIVKHPLSGSQAAQAIESMTSTPDFQVCVVTLPIGTCSHACSSSPCLGNACIPIATETIVKRTGNSPRVILGIGIGGMHVLDYLTRSGIDPHYQAAAFISAGYPTMHACNVYSAKNFIKGGGSDLGSEKLWCEASSGNECCFGDSSKSSAAAVLDGLNIPTLLLHAIDDPLVDVNTLDILKGLKNPLVAFAITEQGGHCGWCDLKGERWSEKLVFEFLEHAIAI